MRRFALAGSASIALAVFVACASGDPINYDDGGDDDTGPPARKPPIALFRSNVQPFIESGTCTSLGCHEAPSGLGNYDLIAPVGTADTVSLQANYDESTCNDVLTAFSNGAAGRLLSYFCTGDGVPSAGHSARVANATECALLYDFAQAGGIGSVASCPAD